MHQKIPDSRHSSFVVFSQDFGSITVPFATTTTVRWPEVSVKNDKAFALFLKLYHIPFQACHFLSCLCEKSILGEVYARKLTDQGLQKSRLAGEEMFPARRKKRKQDSACALCWCNHIGWRICFDCFLHPLPQDCSSHPMLYEVTNSWTWQLLDSLLNHKMFQRNFLFGFFKFVFCFFWVCLHNQIFHSHSIFQHCRNILCSTFFKSDSSDL